MNLNVKGESMALWSRPSSDDAYGKLLKSMESSLRSNINISKDNLNSLNAQSVLLSYIHTSAREISLNVQNLSTSITGSAEKMSFNLSRSLSFIKSLNDTMKDLSERVSEDIADRDDSDSSRDSDRGISELSDKFTRASNILNKMSGYLKIISERASAYHDYTNALLKYTGSSSSEASSYRGELAQNIVSELNSDIGKQFFNSTESYKLLSEIALNANIGSLEALEEISRPVLLAESALQTDVTRIAELFNKFYLRYNFSSLSMEAMVDNILTYTANNQAQAASVTEGIYELSDEIAIFARGDENRINQYTDTLAKSLSWVEGLGQNSSTYTSDLDKIFSGAHYTDQGLRQILKMGGLNTVQAQELAKSGDFETLIEALFTGRAMWGQQIIDNPRLADILPAYGLSEEELENAYGAYLGPNYQSISQFTPEEQQAEESLGERFLSVGEQLTNYISKFDEFVAFLEEKMNLSFSDIAGILTAIAGVIGVSRYLSGGSNILSALFGGAGATSATGGILGGIKSMLPALGIGGAVAMTVGAALFGIYSGLKNSNIIIEESYGATVGGTYDEGVTPDTSYGFSYSGDPEDPNVGIVEGMEYDPDTARDNIYSYYNDLLNQGIHDRGVSTASNGSDIIPSMLENAGKAIVGTGWFSNGEAEWYHYIPIFGGAIAGVESITDTVAQDPSSRADKASEFLASIQNMSPERVEVLKAYTDLYPDITSEQKIDRMLYFMENEDWITQAYSRPHLWTDAYASGRLKGYATGTNYIPYDQVAYLHEGEAVVPKKYNPAANPTEMESIKERASSLREDSSEYYRESLSVLRDLQSSLGELIEIRKFLAAWKEENMTRETIKDNVSRLNYQRSTVSGYLPLQV